MATMTLSVPDELMAFIEDQVAVGGYASANEFLRDLIRDAQKHRARLELESKLLEGLQGPLVEMTREDWESIRRQALDGLTDETLRP
jgi:antitoxin ParD1/3/4